MPFSRTKTVARTTVATRIRAVVVVAREPDRVRARARDVAREPDKVRARVTARVEDRAGVVVLAPVRLPAGDREVTAVQAEVRARVVEPAQVRELVEARARAADQVPAGVQAAAPEEGTGK